MFKIDDNYIQIRLAIFQSIEADVVSKLSQEDLLVQIMSGIETISNREKIPLSFSEKSMFVKQLCDELIGLGPLQALMDDDSINDIMVNGPNHVYIERDGLLEKSNVFFVDEIQLQTIAKRIASSVGRRLDDSSPMCDARLPDGSRVNMVLPPIALDGTSISIRKFKKQKIKLTDLVAFGSMTNEMAKVLMVAAHCRLNIIVSGGTGSGKTTLLNCLAEFISDKERIITIEDAAELSLPKEHVQRMETRKANIEGAGAIDQQILLINALRMRPDRIIIGECRGAEALEMLQAMNTGHDGSMTTLHANTPRDAISRIESMVMMGNANLPLVAIKKNIVAAIDLIVQIKRFHDGSRKVTHITEVSGLEGDVVIMSDYFLLNDNIDLKEKNNDNKYTKFDISATSKLKIQAANFGIDVEL